MLLLFCSYFSPIEFPLLFFLFPVSLGVLFISYFSPVSGNHGFSRLSTPEVDIRLDLSPVAKRC